MAHSIERMLEADRCEPVIAEIGDFVDRHYDEANIRARQQRKPSSGAASTRESESPRFA